MKFKAGKKLPPAKPALERIYADPDIGLSSGEVSERKEKGYSNIPVASPVKTVKQIIIGNIFTYFNMIFFIMAAALIINQPSYDHLSDYYHLSFLPPIFANLIIGIIQELNAKKVLDKLTLISSPHARTVRNGVETVVLSEEVVIDDIVIFGAGNQICADGMVVSGEIQVNESLVTGEPDEVIRRPGDRLLSGSFVISGECRAGIEKVGADSFVSQLTLNAKKTRKNKDKGMMGSLNYLVKVIGILIIPLGLMNLLKETRALGEPISSAVEKTVAALLGFIPEGLYLLTSVALAVGVIRLAKQRTLVHDLKCIESLARVDVLCVDKTGTITENSMDVTDIVPVDSHNYDLPFIAALLKDFAGNHSPDNATMKALKSEFGGGAYRQAAQIMPFSSAAKYSAAVIGGDTYILGAPEFLLLDAYQRYRSVIEAQIVKGGRVLLFGVYGGYIPAGPLPQGIEPLALIIFNNHIRKEAPAAFEYFSNQGVEIKVISGDNAFAAADAAKRAGIKNADKYVDASALDSNKKLFEAAGQYSVFGRVTPEQKRLLIKALKKQGHTVAMTGDGVNDVLALKEADCSVAMASGSEAACQVSHLVLLDSDFSAMPKVVAEGRRVINNIDRAASLFLVKNIFSIVLTAISIIAMFSYPIEKPEHLSIFSTFTIGIPSFFLALQPNTGVVRGKFLRNVLFRAVPAALTNIFIIIGVLLFCGAFELDAYSSTVSALLIGVVGLIMLFKVCKPYNLLRVSVCVGVSVLFTLAVFLLGDFYSLTPLDYKSKLIFSVFALMAYPAMVFFTNLINYIKQGAKYIINKLRALIKKHKETKDDTFDE